jgi:hypothetical protein
VHAAAVLGVAGLQRPLMGVQAFVFGQQRRVDVEQAALVVAHEVALRMRMKPASTTSSG